MAVLTAESDIRRALDDAKVVAVLGAHTEDHRAAFYVPDYLHEQGYRILPVNPNLVGQTLWGEPVRASLADLDEAVDIVDVFRNSRHLVGHTVDFLRMAPAPKVVWFQLGVRSDEVAAVLSRSGIDVVQDRCTLADHKHWGLGPR